MSLREDIWKVVERWYGLVDIGTCNTYCRSQCLCTWDHNLAPVCCWQKEIGATWEMVGAEFDCGVRSKSDEIDYLTPHAKTTHFIAGIGLDY